MIDVNVYLGRWPFRRLPLDQPERLVAKLREQGVTRAWAGSLDALLHRDMAAVNARLAEECRRHAGGLLVPFGTVNPTLPDWPEDLRRCREEHGMPGVRLFPGYHGYGLDAPGLAELLDAAAGRGMVVQVAWRMEDDRTRHPGISVATPDAGPLLGLVERIAGLRLVLLNASRDLRGEALARLLATGRVFAEVATLEGLAALETLVGEVGTGGLMFGSLAPLFVFEAAALKLKEAALEADAEEAIRSKNASKLIGSG